MVAETQLSGADQFRAMALRLERLARKGFISGFDARIEAALKPLQRQLPESARSTLPRGGGLADRVAATRWKTVRRTTRRAARVSLRGQGDVNLRRLDAGRNRHLVYGRPNSWQPQAVAPGWFTRPATAATPAIKAAIKKAVEDTAREIGGPL